MPVKNHFNSLIRLAEAQRRTGYSKADLPPGLDTTLT